MKIDGNGRGLGIGVFGPDNDRKRGPRLEPVGRPFREAQPPKPNVDRLPAQPPIDVEEGATYNKPRRITGQPIRLPVQQVTPEDIAPIKGKGSVSIDPVPVPAIQVDPGDAKPIKNEVSPQIDPPLPVPVIQVQAEAAPAVGGDEFTEPRPILKYQGSGGGVAAKPDPETIPIDRSVEIA